jgi:hypothetical protein
MQHSRGGNWLLDDGVRECTSGWTVGFRSLLGALISGIITAGHCDGLNQFEQPGITPYRMILSRRVRDARGDVALYSTSHEELAEFYSSDGIIRDVTSIRTTNTMVGNYVCVYGRASHTRTCDHIVQAVGVTVLADGIVSVGNLARASNASTMGGDSGGRWSWANTAWGVHHGRDSSGNSYFTPVQEAQDAVLLPILIK